jgi:hypothetical protein
LEFEEIATMQTLTPLIQSEEIRAKLLPRQYSIQIHEMRQDEFLFYFSPFFYEFFFLWWLGLNPDLIVAANGVKLTNILIYFLLS